MKTKKGEKNLYAAAAEKRTLTGSDAFYIPFYITC